MPEACRLGKGRYAEAAQVLHPLDTSFPSSPWRRRARFDAAQAHARQRDFQAAEVIYRSEAEYLFGPDRKQQIADIYLEFADAAFTPKDKQAEPNHQKALEFYQAALDLNPRPEKQAENEMLVARCHQELGDNGTAVDDYARFIRTYPNSDMVVDARFRMGQCQLADKKPAEARRTWQDLLAAHAGFPNTKTPRRPICGSVRATSTSSVSPKPPIACRSCSPIFSLPKVTRFPRPAICSDAVFSCRGYDDAIRVWRRELQGEQTKQLDKMYKEGGAMGGMGGGFF